MPLRSFSISTHEVIGQGAILSGQLPVPVGESNISITGRRLQRELKLPDQYSVPRKKERPAMGMCMNMSGPIIAFL